jgi:hypothetical protein
MDHRPVITEYLQEARVLQLYKINFGGVEEEVVTGRSSRLKAGGLEGRGGGSADGWGPAPCFVR